MTHTVPAITGQILGPNRAAITGQILGPDRAAITGQIEYTPSEEEPVIPFDPADVSGYYADWDVNQATDNESVPDISGNGNDLAAAATPVTNITLSSDQINGKKALVHGGGGDSYIKTFASAQAIFTMYIVVAGGVDGPDVYVFDDINSTSRIWLRREDTERWRTSFGGSGTIPITTDQWRIIKYVSNGASSFDEVNGVANTTGDVAAASLDGIRVGSIYNNSAGFLDGKWARIIMYNSTVSDADDALIKKYLFEQYASITFDEYQIGTETDFDHLSVVDLDGDGKIDVAGGTSTTTPSVYWWKQTSPKSWTRYTIEAPATGTKIEGGVAFRKNNIAFYCALDQGDGIIRMYYAADPTSTWTGPQTLVSSRPNLQDVVMLDVDGDGQDEILYTWEGADSLGSGGVNWLKFTGSDPTNPAHWTDYVMIQEEGSRVIARGADESVFTADGGIIVACRNSPNTTASIGAQKLTPTGTVTDPWTQTVIHSTTSGWNHCDRGDFFGDGSDDDLVMSTNSNNTLLLKRATGGYSTAVTPSGINAGAVFNVRTMPAAYDMNSRNSFIVFETGSGDRPYIFYWDGSAWAASDATRQFGLSISKPDDVMYWYDLDGDGVKELFFCDANDGLVKWFRPVTVDL